MLKGRKYSFIFAFIAIMVVFAAGIGLLLRAQPKGENGDVNYYQYVNQRIESMMSNPEAMPFSYHGKYILASKDEYLDIYALGEEALPVLENIISEEEAKGVHGLRYVLARQIKQDIINQTNLIDLTNPIVYKNTQYGFHFSLPEGWAGYTIVNDVWEGLKDGKMVETGPLLLIRHPQWTAQDPRQDIPIMVFTLSQWALLQQQPGGFHIGAGPTNPSELGRNTEYVFALPARYIFHYRTGYEEVRDIFQGNPLQTNEN